MRSFSVKSSAFALIVALTLTTTSAFAAGRQTRDRDRSWGPIDRVIQVVKRIIGAEPHDGIMPPIPAPQIKP